MLLLSPTLSVAWIDLRRAMTTEFHVLLSYNSADRPFVRKICEELKRRKLNTWLDEDQMTPGSVTDQLSKVLDSIPTALIIIGPNDQGPWQRKEVNSLITRSNTTGMRPILLIPIYLAADLEEKFPASAFLRDEKHYGLHSDADLEAIHATSSICKIVQGIWDFCKLPGSPPIPNAPPLPPPQPWPAENANYVWPLADRKGEFEQLRRVLSGQTCERVVTVVAEGNSGKTTFLKEIKHYAQKGVGLKTCQLNLKGGTKLESLMQVLGLSLGGERFGFRQGVSAGTLGTTVLNGLKQQLEPCLLLIDHYEDATDDVREFFELFVLRFADQLPAVAFLVAGRKVPSAAEHGWDHSELPLLLPEICEQDYYDYSRQQPELQVLNYSHVEAIVSAVGRDPGIVIPTLVRFARGKAVTQ